MGAETGDAPRLPPHSPCIRSIFLMCCSGAAARELRAVKLYRGWQKRIQRQFQSRQDRATCKQLRCANNCDVGERAIDSDAACTRIDDPHCTRARLEILEDLFVQRGNATDRRDDFDGEVGRKRPPAFRHRRRQPVLRDECDVETRRARPVVRTPRACRSGVLSLMTCSYEHPNQMNPTAP